LLQKKYLQQPRHDCTEVFAFVFHSACLCLKIVQVAKEGFKMQSLDISSVFTYEELNKTIYIRQPEGHHQRESNIVCKQYNTILLFTIYQIYDLQP